MKGIGQSAAKLLMKQANIFFVVVCYKGEGPTTVRRTTQVEYTV